MRARSLTGNAGPMDHHSPFSGHSTPERPLLGYLTLSGFYALACAAFATWMRRSGRRLPEHIDPGDIALISVATHKASRLVTKDRVTSGVRAPFTEFQGDAGPAEVDEAARGRGLRRAIGELLICPYCLGMWIATAFTAGLVTAPRPTRTIATVFTTLFVSDSLQLAYKKAEDEVTA